MRARTVHILALIVMRVIIRVIRVVWMRNIHLLRLRCAHHKLERVEQLFFISHSIVIQVECFHGLLGLGRCNNVLDSQSHEEFIEQVSHL